MIGSVLGSLVQGVGKMFAYAMPALGSMGPLLDDFGMFAGRMYRKLGGSKHAGFTSNFSKDWTGNEQAMHQLAITPFWMAEAAAGGAKTAMDMFTGGVQGMWDQDPNTFQNMGSQAGQLAQNVGDFGIAAAFMVNAVRRDKPGMLGDAYALRKTGNRLTNTAVKSGRENIFVKHLSADMKSTNLYKASEMEYTAGTGWSLSKGAQAVASSEGGSLPTIGKYMSENKMSQGFLSAEGRFMGMGIGTLARGIGATAMVAVASAAIGGAATIAGAIVDDNMQHYYSAQRPFRDERQFNNPMMQMWQMSNYQSAAGAYESNGMSLSRIYHTK